MAVGVTALLELGVSALDRARAPLAIVSRFSQNSRARDLEGKRLADGSIGSHLYDSVSLARVVHGLEGTAGPGRELHRLG